MPNGLHNKPLFGFIGWSGSGKTTLLEKTLPFIAEKGLTFSTVKHAHHKVDIDKPGKDSYRHRAAGAQEVMLATNARWFLIRELRTAPEPSLEDLIEKMSPVDIIFVEGFKRTSFPKLEVYRPEIGKDPLWKNDPSIVAVASDDPTLTGTPKLLDLNNPQAIAAFICDVMGL